MLALKFADLAIGLVALACDLYAVVLDPDDQAAEVRGNEVTAYRVRCSLIKVAGLAEKVDVCERSVGAVLKPVERHVELLLDCFSLERRTFDPFADLRNR
ncbi:MULTISPECIES: hypothetical protein [unclassified Microbacterium]|uniref:hypothetical protein n=1 Tax=unclassified Microbacterium TaxID=2609290 RepID=UPI00365358DC